MQFSTTHIPLRYTSSEYKFEQITSIPKKEVCALSLSTVEELFEKNIKQGFPHVLALVHDVEKGQDIFDANLLGEYLAKSDRWKWLNPATQKLIRKIDYFVINQLSDGYRLVKEINTEKIGTGETYEALWFCNNLASASDPENPYAFHSMRAMALHYSEKKLHDKEKEIKFNWFKFIENNFGKGVAILLIPAIFDMSNLFERILFHSFNYEFINSFFHASELHNLIPREGKDFFDPKKRTNNQILYEIGLAYTFENNSEHPAFELIKCLCLILNSTSFSPQVLNHFLNHTDKSIVAFTQAFLCTLGDVKDVYIKNLRQCYPEWPLGEAYELNTNILSNKEIDVSENSLINKFVKLSSTSKDPLVLKSIATLFDRFKLQSTNWKNSENIYMRMIGISRYNINAVEMFAKAIEESEIENSLSLLTANFRSINSYNSLLKLSDLQISIGIRNKNKALYKEGVDNGISIYNNRAKHDLLTFTIGRILVAEITPYKSNKEQESTGVAALMYTLDSTSSKPHPVARLNLAEYYIRKGTILQAKQAHVWLLELQKENPNNLFLPYYFIRYALRFANSEDDLNIIEAQLAEIAKLDNKSPLFYLLKALWYNHPLKRNHPEWYILASQNLTTAFKDADHTSVDFLLKNLHRFDKLTEEDLIKCKADILGLLGLGDN